MEISERTRISNLFIEEDYIKHEIPEEGTMYYNQEEEKTYFLNNMAKKILVLGETKNIGEITDFLFTTYQQDRIDRAEILADVLELSKNLLNHQFIELVEET